MDEFFQSNITSFCFYLFQVVEPKEPAANYLKHSQIFTIFSM